MSVPGQYVSLSDEAGQTGGSIEITPFGPDRFRRFIDNIRGVEFIHPLSFTFPSREIDIFQRVRSNLSFCYSNYVIIALTMQLATWYVCL